MAGYGTVRESILLQRLVKKSQVRSLDQYCAEIPSKSFFNNIDPTRTCVLVRDNDHRRLGDHAEVVQYPYRGYYGKFIAAIDGAAA
jgi:hypothetical protein